MLVRWTEFSLSRWQGIVLLFFFRNTFHWLVKTSRILLSGAVRRANSYAFPSCCCCCCCYDAKLFVCAFFRSCLTVYRKLVPFSVINDFISIQLLLYPMNMRIFAFAAAVVVVVVVVVTAVLQLFHLLFYTNLPFDRNFSSMFCCSFYQFNPFWHLMILIKV